VAAVIPAFNEEAHIGAVIDGVREVTPSVLVVDDGSDDATARVAAQAGAEVRSHPARLGKGSAIRTGLDTVRGRGHRWVLFLDADGQHHPADARALLDAAEERGYDLVIGHRAFDRSLNGAARYYTNLVGCNMLSRWTGIDVLDSQSGYRVVRAAALEGIELDARGFEIETEILLKLCRRGARVGQVEVRGIRPPRKSRLRPVRDVTRICLSALKYHYMSS
jgi:glycosyltransferase involved in cell wall biosynthesis